MAVVHVPVRAHAEEPAAVRRQLAGADRGPAPRRPQARSPALVAMITLLDPLRLIKEALVLVLLARVALRGAQIIFLCGVSGARLLYTCIL